MLEPLRPEYERLHEQAREFATMAAEASSKHQLSMAEASRATKITMANLQQVFDAKALVFKVYEDNVSRIVMAYSKAAREIKQDLQKKLAGE